MEATSESYKEWKVKKRTGEIVQFKIDKISKAIFLAAKSVGGSNIDEAEKIAQKVVEYIQNNSDLSKPLEVESIQDSVEKILIEEGHAKTAKAYILYRSKQNEKRELESFESADNLELDDKVSVRLKEMFKHRSKVVDVIGKDIIKDYQVILFKLRKMQRTGELPLHKDNNYLSGSELAENIYKKKYYLKDEDGKPIEERPEDVFARIASFVGTMEASEKKQLFWSSKYYDHMYKGYFIPGGRIIAGSGDLFRLKTLSNCFVTLIEKDNIESIYKSAYDCARTYSYGGGIGVDISVLRPKNSVVHNAADHSTGAVSFMELYSMTTGLIGQSGRRGALMLTIDVKHPDVIDFIQVKKISNWVTKQIKEQCTWSGLFNEKQIEEIERQVRENTQVRFANISVKVSDEFMQAVDEETKYGKDKLLVYEKSKDVDNGPKEQTEENHYSYSMPQKPIEKYKLLAAFDTVDELNKFLKDKGHLAPLSSEDINNIKVRDIFGDYVIKGSENDYAIRYAGDFMLYFNSKQTGEIKNLVKARDIWNKFVEGNYYTAEPGLIFWTEMTKYSPSNYVGRPISSTNPCGEVPLESGGACNLASINLSRMVIDGYSEKARIDMDRLKETVYTTVRFLDNVISWNQKLNPLEEQREAAKLTRRIGLGIIGIADMLNQLGIGYDSDEGMMYIDKIMKYIANRAYEASSMLAAEKGTFPLYDFESYSKSPFFNERLDEDVKEKIRENGLRNVAILSIAPTGTISNIVLGYKEGDKNYIGVSGGVEPIFALYYTRRSESFGNVFFKVFHSTVQAYIDKKGLTDEAKNSDEEKLRDILPEHFFRTSHNISPERRVKIQGICQKYVDQSISSTVNLPEDIDPETISNIYLDAWKNRLKGITVYREGSRYPILQSEEKKTDFQNYKEKIFKLKDPNGNAIEGKGDKVIVLPDGKLTTIYHIIKQEANKE